MRRGRPPLARQHLRQQLHLAQMNLRNLKVAWTVGAHRNNDAGGRRPRLKSEYPENQPGAWKTTINSLDSQITELVMIKRFCQEQYDVLVGGADVERP